jgi:hypothetical protein
MKIFLKQRTSLVFISLSLLCACGGGGANSGSPAGSSAATNYSFVIPQLNSQRIYTESIIDNSSNTINLSYTDTVTAVNTNGTYVVLEADPNNNSTTVNGTTYAIQPDSITLNNSGQPLSSLNNNTQIACTTSPHGAGPTYPIAIGNTWSINYTVTCGSNASTSYSQTGTVIDLESVTMPAGTYSSLKVQSAINFTDSNGTIHNQSFTTWRDSNTGAVLKQLVVYTYSGTPLTHGYPVTNTVVLQSGTP